jgi:hypothetical protein
LVFIGVHRWLICLLEFAFDPQGVVIPGHARVKFGQPATACPRLQRPTGVMFGYKPPMNTDEHEWNRCISDRCSSVFVAKFGFCDFGLIPARTEMLVSFTRSPEPAPPAQC